MGASKAPIVAHRPPRVARRGALQARVTTDGRTKVLRYEDEEPPADVGYVFAAPRRAACVIR